MLKLTRWVMAHRWIVVITWIVVTGALFAASLTVGTRKSNNFSLPNTDSQRAIDLLQSRYPAQAGDTDQIVFHTRTGKLTDASERAVIVPLLAHIAHLPHVAGVVSPYQPGAGAISKTGTIGFATVEFDQAANQLSTASIQNVIHAAESARSPALQVELGGDAITQVLGPSPGFVTLIGLAAAIVVLLISFGSLLAMGLPVVSALFGLGASIGLIALLSHPIDMVDFSSELALMVGLGVGIDYALFVVTRFRQRLPRERRPGRGRGRARHEHRWSRHRLRWQHRGARPARPLRARCQHALRRRHRRLARRSACASGLPDTSARATEIHWPSHRSAAGPPRAAT